MHYPARTTSWFHKGSLAHIFLSYTSGNWDIAGMLTHFTRIEGNNEPVGSSRNDLSEDTTGKSEADAKGAQLRNYRIIGLKEYEHWLND